jgi:hypothetical protein
VLEDTSFIKSPRFGGDSLYHLKSDISQAFVPYMTKSETVQVDSDLHFPLTHNLNKSAKTKSTVGFSEEVYTNSGNLNPTLFSSLTPQGNPFSKGKTPKKSFKEARQDRLGVSFNLSI